MKLPRMKYASRIYKGTQVSFGGLNQCVGGGDGELAAMRNITSDHYPVMASRPVRWKYRTLDAPGGMYSWEGLAWVDGDRFYFKGEEKGTLTPGEKQFASLGAYIVIFPDKCWYNVDSGEFGSMEASWEGDSLTFQDGTSYGEEAKGNTVTAPGVHWENYFREGDAVTISGCQTVPGNNISIIIREIDGEELRFYENSFTLGEEGAAVTETGNLAIRRTVPELTFLCENENRLWGCTENTIYASKLGDIFNWNVYDGLQSDSYAVDTGSAGSFTGCVSYGGYPTFFKEDHIYKVYGSEPSNFEVMGSATLGLQKGSHRSLAIAGETMFYLSRNGIMAYSGGIPQSVGAAFGTERFRNGVAGSDGLKYYISMEGQKGWGLYVYDTQLGLWHREDETRAMRFAKWNGQLYMLNEAGEIWTVGDAPDPPLDAEPEEEITWMAEFGDFTEGSPNQKGVGKLQLRLELEDGAWVEVYMMFDSDRQWHRVSSVMGEGEKRSYYLPITPRRCDHFRVKLEGCGGCRIYSMAREYYAGSEMRSRWGRN